MIETKTDTQREVQHELDKVAYARYGKPYSECDFEQQNDVVDESCQHTMFALTENAILLKKLQFNLKRA